MEDADGGVEGEVEWEVLGEGGVGGGERGKGGGAVKSAIGVPGDVEELVGIHG